VSNPIKFQCAKYKFAYSSAEKLFFLFSLPYRMKLKTQINAHTKVYLFWQAVLAIQSLQIINLGQIWCKSLTIPMRQM
jgi:hypothetical protein